MQCFFAIIPRLSFLNLIEFRLRGISITIRKKRSDLFQRFRIIRTPSDFPKTDASGLNDFKFKKYYASSIAFPISWRMYFLAKFTHSVAS